MPNENPSATVDQLMAALAANAGALEAGAASIRKNELMQKSLTGQVTKEENVELARILSAETGLTTMVAKAYASEALQKSLAAVPVEGLKPVFEATSAASQKSAEVVATAVSDARGEYNRWSRAQGQVTTLMAKLLVEQNKLIKSMVERVEALEKQPAVGPKGYFGQQPAAVAPQPVAPVAPAAASQGQLGGPQMPNLNKSQLTDKLIALYQEAASGTQLPYGLGHTQIRDAIAHVDMDQPLHPMVAQLVADRSK